MVTYNELQKKELEKFNTNEEKIAFLRGCIWQSEQWSEREKFKH